MKRLCTALGFAAVLGIAASQASEPGQPLGDCNDWITGDGISCELVEPYPCQDASGIGLPICALDSPDAPSNEGGFFTYRRVQPDGSGPCESEPWAGVCCRIEVWEAKRESAEGRIVATIDERCDVSGGSDGVQSLRLAFDEEAGVLYVVVTPDGDYGCSGYHCRSVVAFSPFTTTFEIQQSYEPSAGGLSFLVPVMPEGFSSVDHFDTYYGDLASAGDWSSAQGLRCGFPNSPPATGQRLTVSDPLPPPLPGHGYWYLTAAVSEQLETRFGRRFRNGVLSGRQGPLPPCAGSF